MTQAKWLRRGKRRKTEDEEEDVKSRRSAAVSAYVCDQVGLVASATHFLLDCDEVVTSVCMPTIWHAFRFACGGDS